MGRCQSSVRDVLGNRWLDPILNILVGTLVRRWFCNVSVDGLIFRTRSLESWLCCFWGGSLASSVVFI